MPTRSGRNFSVGETFTSMDPTLQDTLNTLISKIKRMELRLERLEADKGEPGKRMSLKKNDSRSPRHERAQPNNTADTYIKSVKVDAFSFVGRLDPQGYIDWQLAMDHYFR